MPLNKETKPNQTYSYQVNLNLFLCLHLNISSFRLINSRLEVLKLIILIFSLIHRLHQLLKLFAVEYRMIIINFICGISSSFKLQNEMVIWFF